MNMPDPNEADAPLSRLLRAARPTPEIPSQFPENVWRRIEAAETTAGAFAWLESLVGQLLRPRIACAACLLLIAAGSTLGTYEGKQAVAQTAQARYLASVAPVSSP